MKRKITVALFFVILLFGSTMPQLGVQADQIEQESVPAPIFVSISKDDQALTSNTVAINDTVSIQYKADRYTVDGIILLGQGNNLTENVTLAESNNFTLSFDSSAKAYSFYSIEVNITEYTKFYAWAWSGTINNGTREELTNFDQDREGGDAFHYIWVENALIYPTFVTVDNAFFDTEVNGYRVNNETQVTIKYEVSSTTNTSEDRTLYLVFSDNSTNVFNASRSTKVQMVWTSFDTDTHTFALNYTLNSLRLTFFSAYNSRGWERSDAATPKSHLLTSGFSFVSTYQGLHEDEYSDVDLINLNVTVYNITAVDIVFLRYKIFNETTEDAANWTDVELTVVKNTYIENATVSNTTITVFNFGLNYTLNVSQSIIIQAYIKYYNYSSYLGASRFNIVDSLPVVNLINKEITYSNNATNIVFYNTTTTKGNLTSAMLYYGLNNTNLNTSKSVLSAVDLNSLSANTTLTLEEGTYKIMLNVTNTLNRTSSDFIYIVVDFTSPSGAATLNNETSALNAGLVVLNLEFIDEGVNDTGIKTIIINWNDGTVENATGLTSVAHTYRKTGEYTINIEVIDFAGNMYNFTKIVSVVVPVQTDTTTRNSPISIFAVILACFATTLVVKRRKIII